jgi:hypothetical protein
MLYLARSDGMFIDKNGCLDRESGRMMTIEPLVFVGKQP